MLKNIITCIINMIVSRKRIFRSSFSKQRKYRKITINIPKFRKFITNFQKTVKLRKIRKFRTAGKPRPALCGSVQGQVSV